MVSGSYAATNDVLGPEQFSQAMGLWGLFSLGNADKRISTTQRYTLVTSSIGMGVYNLSFIDDGSSNEKIFWNNLLAWQAFGIINYLSYEFFGKKSSFKVTALSDGGMLYYSSEF